MVTGRQEKTQAVVEKYIFHKEENKWKRQCDYLPDCRPTSKQISGGAESDVKEIEPSLVIHLLRGGCVKVVSEEYLERLEEEMTTRVKYRQLPCTSPSLFYPQTKYKPVSSLASTPFVSRTLLTSWRPAVYHADATDEKGLQPGYRYSQITLKAYPLSACRPNQFLTKTFRVSQIPTVEAFSKCVADLCGVEKWRVGVNPICYRDLNDGIRKHSDNNQGETVVTTAIISQDVQRYLVIAPLGNNDDLRQNDEKIKIFLGRGDMYQMDGDMQLNYGHSVPQSTSKRLLLKDKRRRLAIVFRDGKYVDYECDSGLPVESLTPRVKMKRKFGEIEGLEYGNVYTRRELETMGAHAGKEMSVSGSIADGCDSLIVSSNSSKEWDAFCVCVFGAGTKSGAGALHTVSLRLTYLPRSLGRSGSFTARNLAFRSLTKKNFDIPPNRHVSRNKKIRLFRSSKTDPTIIPTRPESRLRRPQAQYYRYDGLFEITHCHVPPDPKEPHLFVMQMSSLNARGSMVLVVFCLFQT
eukprot:scaffold6647_cov166-Amphora_coffeaeformis.AAC.6